MRFPIGSKLSGFTMLLAILFCTTVTDSVAGRPTRTLGPTRTTAPTPPPTTDTPAPEAPTAGSNLTFSHTVIDANPPASYRINEIQIGDIDGDGNNDVWTSGRGGGAGAYQMVWYHNPDWTRYEISPGDYKYGALGDFDGDNDLDIVAGQEDNAEVYWFENTGSPQQSDWPKHLVGITGNPDLLHVGDVNQDGRLDVVYKFKNRFGWAENPIAPENPWPVHDVWSGATRSGGDVADIDLDGDLDVLYGNAWFENPRPGGDPTSGSAWTMRTVDSGWPSEARGQIGDLNKDGRPDIVLTGEESSQGVAWYRAPADVKNGSWTKFNVVSSGYQGVHTAELADFDSDNDLDLLVAEMHTGNNPDKVTVFQQVDIASNTWQEVVLADFGSHNAKAGDIDGDGLPDVVGKNFEAGEIPLRVDYWRNETAAQSTIPDSWEKHVIDANKPWRAVFIDGGDVNGDDLPDIVTGGWWYQNPGAPGGSWTRHTIGGELYNMAVVHDLDGDADLDVLGTKGKVNSDEFVWAQNDGAGTFTLHTNLPQADGDFLQGARAAQIIPGGNVEVILSWHNPAGTQMYSIPQPATDPWSWNVLHSTNLGEQIAIGDVDDDGDLDIHLGTVWLRNDGATWESVPAFNFGDPNADADRVELADVDGDGDLDVVVGAEHAERVVWGEAPDDPNNPWTEHVISDQVLGMSMDVADIDDDGDPDVVIGEHNTQNPNVGKVLLYLNENEGGNWSTIEVDSGLEHHDGTQFVDIDVDGDLDIVSIGWTHGQVVLYENQGSAPDIPPNLSERSWLPILIRAGTTAH